MLGSEEDTLYQSSTSPLQIIESFLEALTNADKDGRVVVNKQGEERLNLFQLVYVVQCMAYQENVYLWYQEDAATRSISYFLLVYHMVYPLAFNLYPLGEKGYCGNKVSYSI